MKKKLYQSFFVRLLHKKYSLALWGLLALLIVTLNGVAFAQNSLVDAGTETTTFTKGGEPIAIAPNLTLANPNLEKASVSIEGANFNADNDRLGIMGQEGTTGTIDGITWTYSEDNGVLTLSGAGNYQAALRQVTYDNVSEAPTGDERTVSITIGNSLYFEGTGHYYEYVANENITWENAKAAAEAKTLTVPGYTGDPITGYLVTVTSAEENEFIAQKLQGNGWMGATDDEEHATWKWVTGPEEGTTFFQQTVGGNGCGTGGQAVNGVYVNWANGEPNDAGEGGCEDGENHAHFLGPNNWDSSPAGTWNDFPNDPAERYGADSNIKVDGYVVEYGGMDGQTLPTLEDEVTIQLVDTPAPAPAEPACACAQQAGTDAQAPAQGGFLDGFEPISIYSLDNGSIEDGITGENNTPAGEIFGDPVSTADRFGNPTGALLFDGVDDYVQTKEDSNKTPLTFSVWFRADDTSDEHSIVDSDVGGSFGHSLIIGYEGAGESTGETDSTLDVQFHDGFWDTGITIEANVWYHAFVTYGDEMRLYLGKQGEDIELVAQQAYTPEGELDGTDFRFGRHNANDQQWFVGAMDDVRFYDEELTEEQIDELSCTCPDQNVDNSTVGDVHIRTPDGLVYDFQERGDFLLTQSGNGEVVLQARQDRWATYPERPVSTNVAAALNVAGDKLEFYIEPELSFEINDVVTPLPTGEIALPQGGRITLTGGSTQDFTIYWPDGNTGARVVLRGVFMDLGIARLAGSLTYEGVLGDMDGNAQNDIQLRGSGEVITPPATNADLVRFGDSWRLSPEESLFNDALAGEDTAAEAEPLTINDLDETEKAAAEETCEAAGVNDPLALHNCTYDVAATGDESFVESAQGVQEDLADEPEETFVAAVPSQGIPAVQPSSEPACYWQQPSGDWVKTSEAGLGDLTFDECFAQDSCAGGLGESGGGCYKWATSSDSEPSWDNGDDAAPDSEVATETVTEATDDAAEATDDAAEAAGGFLEGCGLSMMPLFLLIIGAGVISRRKEDDSLL